MVQQTESLLLCTDYYLREEYLRHFVSAVEKDQYKTLHFVLGFVNIALEFVIHIGPTWKNQ